MSKLETEDRTLAIGHFVRKKLDSLKVEEVLTVLNIPFKREKRWNATRSFWLTNEAELEYIYDDFCKATRYALRDLHPQNGGDPIEFSKFAQAVARIKKQFWKFGVGKNVSLFQALEEQEKREKERELKGPKRKRVVNCPLDTRTSFEEKIRRFPDRFCENPNCGKKLTRRITSRLETFKQFCTRRFCGYNCSAKVQWAKKRLKMNLNK